MNEKACSFHAIHELTDYAGKRVAIVEDEVIASGDNARLVLEQATKDRPGTEPSLAKAPKARFSCPHCPGIDLLCRIR